MNYRDVTLNWKYEVLDGDVSEITPQLRPPFPSLLCSLLPSAAYNTVAKNSQLHAGFSQLGIELSHWTSNSHTAIDGAAGETADKRPQDQDSGWSNQDKSKTSFSRNCAMR